MKENIVEYKSFEFAKNIIKLYKKLSEDKKEYVLSNQLLKSGTSIGANIAEAECGMSKKDFVAKMYLAFKECVETKYWLELLYSSDYINAVDYDFMKSKCEELRRMLSAITKTSKAKL